MTSSVDPQIITEAFRRRGIALPPERGTQLAETASRLASTSRALAERLSFADDVYGLQTFLHQWTKP